MYWGTHRCNHSSRQHMRRRIHVKSYEEEDTCTGALTVPITLPGAELLIRTVTLVKPVAKEKTLGFS